MDLSTVEGANRNRVNKKCMPAFKKMLISNTILETLSLTGVSLGNFGMSVIAKALNHDLEATIKYEKSSQAQVYGKFIRTDTNENRGKDFSNLPELKEDVDKKKRVSLSKVALKCIKLSHNDINESQIFEDIRIGLKYSNLQEIDLSDNALGDNSVIEICKSFDTNCEISKINLSNIKMTWKGARGLLLTVKFYSKLKELTIDRNVLDGSKLRVLKEVIGFNKGLRVLNINSC